MKPQPIWQYDEFRQVGTGHMDPEQVEGYDARHGKFRDVQAQNTAILDALKLTGSETLIDMGAGTGEFALAAAAHCKTVYAVDVSPFMLDVASRKAAREGISNIVFTAAGFLTYTHPADPADAAVSQLALHHLPDFWKLIALQRLARALKPGGTLFLQDVVFAFDPADHAKALTDLTGNTQGTLPPEIALRLAKHVREEYSTTDWIMEGLLERAGFTIEHTDYEQQFLARYLCRKIANK